MTTKERRDDPMLRALAVAPFDDEPTDLDQDASAAEVVEAYRHGDAVSSADLRFELGLER